MPIPFAPSRLRAWSTPALLLLLVGWYGLGTVPYLGDFPRAEWAQMGIAAPAYQLATTGVYGNDLFEGFYRTEVYNYEYLPLYPLLVSFSFKVFGLGLLQARLASVLCGLVTLLLTFYLGRRLYDDTVGLLAVFVLCVVRLGVATDLYGSGILLIDLARVIRYDVLVPAFVLGACLLFLWSHARASRTGYVATGILAGLATLSHMYGAFILAVFGIVLCWQHGGRMVRSAPPYLILAGWALALLPWLLYVLQDVAAYQGQMLRHQDRFDVFDPRFYMTNLMREVYRYTPWVGPSLRTPVLGRPGLWVAAVGVPWAARLLWQRARRTGQASDQLLLVAWPALSLLLALLLSYKRYAYLALTLPFLALWLALLLAEIRHGLGPRKRWNRYGFAVLLLILSLEGGIGMVHAWRQARTTTPYTQIATALQDAIPAGARVLLSQPFWLALADYETRSINLAFVLSDPRYGLRPARTMAEALQAIDPDYVVVERTFLEDYVDDPNRLPWPRHQWSEFGASLKLFCRSLLTTIRTPDYGDVLVYGCGSTP